MTILIDTTIIHDIPVLTLTPSDAEHRPAIFFIHGFGSSKEAGLNLGYQLAQRGFCFISFDAWLHGERSERHNALLEQAALPDRGGIYPPDSGLDTFLLFYRAIDHCRADVQTLIDHFADDPRLDVTRCGIAGLSLGGYATYSIFARLPQMQAAVPMMGVPSFTRRWLDLLDECAFSNPDWAAALDRVIDQTQQHTAFVTAIDPLEKLQHAAPRALLIMNNDFDSDQPKHYAIDCYRELQSSYAAQPDRLKLNIYPAGHTVTPQMERDMVEWFVTHLF
jgi:pimeloyl-ACP methyl ester carboxylesterase